MMMGGGVQLNPIRLVCGNAGRVMTTTDGINYTLNSTVGTAPILSALIVGNTWLVGNTVGQIYVSTNNGANWALRTSGFASNQIVRALEYSKKLGLYVAAGDGGRIATSPDTITWTQRTSGSTALTYDLEWVESTEQFIAGRNASQDGIRSTDGISWTGFTIFGASSPTTFVKSQALNVIAGHLSTVISTNGGNTFGTDFGGGEVRWDGMFAPDGSNITVGVGLTIRRNGAIVLNAGTGVFFENGITNDGTMFAVGWTGSNTNSTNQPAVAYYSLNNGQNWINANLNLGANTAFTSVSRVRAL